MRRLREPAIIVGIVWIVGSARAQQQETPVAEPPAAAPDSVGAGSAAQATAGATEGRSPQDEARRGKLLFRVGSHALRVGELEDQVSDPRVSPVVRASYADPDRIKEEYERRVKWAVLAEWARRTGLAGRADIVMVVRRKLGDEVLRVEVAEKITDAVVTDEEIRDYYEEHVDLYNRPEMVQVAEIRAPDRAGAEVALERALAARGNRIELARLVRELSQNAETKRRGGTLGTFDADGRLNRVTGRRGGEEPPAIPPEIVSAAFTMTEPFDVYPQVVETSLGFHILFLQHRIEAVHRSLDEVADRIRPQIRDRHRDAARRRYIEDVRERLGVAVNDGAFDKVVVAPSESIPVSPGVQGLGPQLGPGPPHHAPMPILPPPSRGGP